MKKLLIMLFIILTISMQSYASDMTDYSPTVPPSYIPDWNPKAPTILYDISESQEYHKKLRDAFYKKYARHIDAKTIELNAPEGAYEREVTKPYLEYRAKNQYKDPPPLFFPNNKPKCNNNDQNKNSAIYSFFKHCIQQINF